MVAEPANDPRCARVSAPRAALVVLALALASCDDPKPQPKPSPSLCEVVRAGCEQQSSCKVFVFNTVSDVEGCVAASGCAEREAAYQGHDIVFQTEAARTCIEGLAARRCDELVVTVGSWTEGSISALEVIPGCNELFAGTRQIGGSCVEDIECAPGLTCEFPGYVCPGKCAKTECTFGACGDDSFCDELSHRCLLRVGAGQRCASTVFENACADGYRCVHDSESYASTCVPQIPAGKECSDFDFFTCAGGTICDTELRRCAAPHAIGEQCFDDIECGQGAFCDVSENVCRPWGTNGDSCSASFRACGPDLYCLMSYGDVECVNDEACGLGGSCCGGACVDFGAECAEPPGICLPEPDGDEPYQPQGVEKVMSRPVAALGESCNDAVCGLGLACRAVDVLATEWRCEEGPKLGESCSPGGQDALIASLNNRAHDALAGCAEGICDTLPLSDWTCVEPKPAGSACTREGFTRECHSLRCKDGRCLDFLSSCDRPPWF